MFLVLDDFAPSLTGKRRGRPDDTVGFATVANAITFIHAKFLNKGGLDCMFAGI